jgi:hypothetical protein
LCTGGEPYATSILHWSRCPGSAEGSSPEPDRPLAEVCKSDLNSVQLAPGATLISEDDLGDAKIAGVDAHGCRRISKDMDGTTTEEQWTAYVGPGEEISVRFLRDKPAFGGRLKQDNELVKLVLREADPTAFQPPASVDLCLKAIELSES